MRGRTNEQPQLFYAIDLEERIRADHPLRPVKQAVDAILAGLSHRFAQAYPDGGRPSVPPERLLKALLLMTLYTIRSERQLIERIDTDLLFRWFLDMDPQEAAFDATTITKNRPRLEDHGLIAAFFDAVVQQAIDKGLASDDHFSVDGTMIEAYGSIKNFKPIAEAEEESGDDKSGDDKSGDDKSDGKAQGGQSQGTNSFKSRNASVDFHGKKRSNQTHRSVTDPEARLYKKGNGQPAKMAHLGHAVIENRNGLVMAVEVTEANGTAERTAAIAMIDTMKERHGIEPKTLGSDKGYHDGGFYLDLEARDIIPHSAMPTTPPGDPANVAKADREKYDARERMRARQATIEYRVSQRCRKKNEEIFGWAKTIGGIVKSRFTRRWKLKQQMELVGAMYNLLRIRKLTSKAA